ncbi:MAG: hypothetical protein R3B07_35380 [Polyangiaceae bacterium]
MTWLSLAALCGGCTSDPGDAGKATGGAAGGSGASGGDGGRGSGTPGGCGDPNGYCDCDEGYYHANHDYYCDPWTVCEGDEVTINVPNDLEDRVCARVEFVDQFGTADRDTATALAANPDGNLCVSGTRSTGPAGAVRSVGAYVRKYGPDGAVLWTQRFEGDGAEVTDVAIDAAGNCYSAGLSAQPESGDGAWFVRKHTATGAVDWEVTGSTAAHAPGQVAVDLDGNVFASFVTRSPGATSAPQHTELMKFDPTGELSWSASVGVDDLASTVFALSGGEAMVVRSTGQGTALDQYATTVHVTRLTEAGAVSWERGYKAYQVFKVKDIAVGPSGDAFLAGSSTNSDTGTVFKLDPGGNGAAFSATSDLLAQIRSGDDGSVWLRGANGISAWTGAGEGLYGLAAYNLPIQIRDFAPIPGFVVLVGEPTKPLAGQTDQGMGDAVVLKLRVD